MSRTLKSGLKDVETDMRAKSAEVASTSAAVKSRNVSFGTKEVWKTILNM